MKFVEKWKMMDSLERWDSKLKIGLVFLLSPVFVFLGIKLIGPDCLTVHFSRTHWSMGADVLVEHVPKPFLFFKLASDPPGFELPWNRIIVLDAEDGSTLGTLTDSFYYYVLGVTPEEVWVQGSGRKKQVTAYSLPGMERLYDLESLTAGHSEVDGIVRKVEVHGTEGQIHLDCRDGYHYLLNTRNDKLEKLPLEHPPPKPSLLYRKCKWKSPGPIYDKRSCVAMKAGPDTIWLDSIKEPGQQAQNIRLISRRSAKGTIRWKTLERDIFPNHSDDEHRLSYDLSVIYNERIYLSAGDGLDFYVAALDAKNGSVIWSRNFW